MNNQLSTTLLPSILGTGKGFSLLCNFQINNLLSRVRGKYMGVCVHDKIEMDSERK